MAGGLSCSRVEVLRPLLSALTRFLWYWLRWWLGKGLLANFAHFFLYILNHQPVLVEVPARHFLGPPLPAVLAQGNNLDGFTYPSRQ
jgi:hypothetical protein